MKNYFLILFCWCSQICIAQTYTYIPFPDSNAIWRVNGWYQDQWNQYQEVDYQYFTGGDTIINGQKWVIINGSGYAKYNNETFMSGRNGYIRNDTLTKRVYYRRSFTPSGTDTLLYDFNLNIGDSISEDWYTLQSSGGYPTLYVYDIDTLLVHNTMRRILFIKDASNSHNEILIEGMGSSQGFNELLNPFEENTQLLCFSLGDTTLWPSISFAPCALVSSVLKNEEVRMERSFMPNPFMDKLLIRYSQNQYSGILRAELRDVFGKVCARKVLIGEAEIDCSGLPDGFYIGEIIQEEKVISRNKLIKISR